jgi:hypothetical protein
VGRNKYDIMTNMIRTTLLNIGANRFRQVYCIGIEKILIQGENKLYVYRVQSWSRRQHTRRYERNSNRGGRFQHGGQAKTTCPPVLEEKPRLMSVLRRAAY